MLGYIAVQSTGISAQAFSAVDPVTNWSPALGRPEALPITGYRIAFFLLLILALGVVIARPRRHPRQLRAPSLTSAGLLALIVVAFIVPTISRPAILAQASNPPQVCHRDAGISYCVHAGHRSELPAVRRLSQKLLAVNGGPPSALHSIRDRALARPGDNEASPATAWFELYPGESVASSVTYDLSGALAGGNACAARYPTLTNGTPEPYTAESALATALGDRTTSVRQYEGGFSKLTTPELTAWIAAHRAAIAACKITANDLP